MKPYKKATWRIALASALCAPGMAAALPSCIELTTNPAWGLAGNAALTSVTSQQMPASGSTPTHCRVDLVQSTPGLCGPKAGYDVGQCQRVAIRLALPEKSAWNGKLMASTGPGSQGQVASTSSFGEGITLGSDAMLYAIRRGYMGSTTDAGHITGEQYGVTSLGTINEGKMTDWSHRASADATRWAKKIAPIYYGVPVARAYWNGCSGAGFQGMGQLQKHAEEYDGFLIGAPAMMWDRFFVSYAWRGLVIRDDLLSKGKSLTAGQIAAANASAIKACDAADGVTDGILTDPRACTFSAARNVCGMDGAPAAPNCLDADQAAAIDKIWDGPRNAKGKRIWFAFDRGINFSAAPGVANAASVIPWHHRDSTFNPQNVFLNREAIAAAGNPPGAISYEDEARLGSEVVGDLINNHDPDLKKARKRGVKVIVIHGTQDGSIQWRNSVDYYRRVAIHSAKGFDDLQSWYRLFPMPGVGHCSVGFGGLVNGPGADEPFQALERWVEHREVPHTLQARGGAVATRTRPLCPYPQTAIYNGSGSTDDAANFRCGGNLETFDIAVSGLHTKYKLENTSKLESPKKFLELAEPCRDQARHCKVDSANGDDED